VVVVTRGMATCTRAYRATGRMPTPSPGVGSFCIGLDWEGALGSGTIRTIDGTHSLEATAYQGALRIFAGGIAEYGLVVLK
jgi:hypothetical protein